MEKITIPAEHRMALFGALSDADALRAAVLELLADLGEQIKAEIDAKAEPKPEEPKGKLGDRIIAFLKANLHEEEPDYSGFDIPEIAEELGVAQLAINGALGHLIEAGLVYTIDEEDHGMNNTGWVINGRRQKIGKDSEEYRGTFVHLTKEGWA